MTQAPPLAPPTSPNARPPLLSSQAWGDPSGPQVWLIHGILGSKQNWVKVAQRLSAALPALCVRVVDLRCHGESEGLSPPHTVRACAQDLAALAEAVGAPEALVGHSFGGKVSLAYAARSSAAGRPLHTLWTLDSPLDASFQPGQREVLNVLEACRATPTPQPSRKALSDALVARGLALGVAQWMTTNLKPSPEGGFVWRFDLDGIEALLEDYWRLDGWALLGLIPARTQVHLLRAERGLRWSDEAAARLARERPSARAPVLADAGHWVHIDQPEALHALLAASLSDLGALGASR
jgi:esterase